jgi:hypothetical protein
MKRHRGREPSYAASISCRLGTLTLWIHGYLQAHSVPGGHRHTSKTTGAGRRAEHEVGDRPRRPAIAVKKRVDPVQPPQQVRTTGAAAQGAQLLAERVARRPARGSPHRRPSRARASVGRWRLEATSCRWGCKRTSLSLRAMSAIRPLCHRHYLARPVRLVPSRPTLASAGED